ncbi:MULTISPECIES: hypothetical protein [Delftia]|uniref:Uncharacterized protein n=1 Tax=Delftia lacustris TaxID=558537 RepID=A0A1H3MV86_9BURK|nr:MULTISPECIES: hypothetical protein [Delftia]QPS78361.1 hypothetical protein I6G48_32090 [Delftia acidovorans]QPS84921.1 hypothetical protein I6G47_32765 [Delftia lacustris]SDY79919.1 hypothetical protein SAMN05421547_10835 [Delftia lacustris]
MPKNNPQGRISKRRAFYARNRVKRNTRVILHKEDEGLKTFHITKAGFTHVLTIPRGQGTSMLNNL